MKKAEIVQIALIILGIMMVFKTINNLTFQAGLIFRSNSGFNTNAIYILTYIGCKVIFCLQETGKKIEILNELIDSENQLDRIADKKFEYLFEDNETGHKSGSDYRMIVVRK